MKERGWAESEGQAKKDQNILQTTAFLNASLLLILNVYMVLNVYTGTEYNAAHGLCITVPCDVQIIDENCCTMGGIILD